MAVVVSKRIGLKALLVVGMLGLVLTSYSPPVEAAYYSEQFTLNAGDTRYVQSHGTNYSGIQLKMQSDGNLVLYKLTWTGGSGYSQVALWNSGTWGHPGARAVMQGDGNLVVYGPSNEVLWHSHTGGHPSTILVLSGGGNMTIFNWDSTSLWSTNTSQVNQNSGSKAPWHKPFADGSWHSHVSTESNGADRADWQWRIDGPGGEDVYEPTDLTFTKVSSYSSWVDVYWYQTTSTEGIADTLCMAWATSEKCDRFRVRFSDEIAGMHSHMQTNGVCHELGHTVGFQDGGLNGSSCMTGGDNARLTWWERNQINWRY